MALIGPFLKRSTEPYLNRYFIVTNYSIFFNAKLLEKFLILEDHHLNFTGDLSFLLQEMQSRREALRRRAQIKARDEKVRINRR